MGPFRSRSAVSPANPWGRRARASAPALVRLACCAVLLSVVAPLSGRGAAAAPAPADRWFYPGEGPAVAVIAPDGTVGGMRAATNGWILLKADEAGAAAVAQAPGVAELVAEPGDGTVFAARTDGRDEAALSRTLRSLPGVRWAHPDLVVWPEPTALPADPFAADQWHLENLGQRGWTTDADIDAERAWAIAAGGGMVAIIDEGVDLLHADLDVVAGYDYADDDADPSPGDGPHGTAAAGLAAAIGGNGVGITGVAQQAQVYGIRLLGGSTSLRNIRLSFIEAVDAGADVLSNSWGFNNGCDSYETYAGIDDGVQYAETVGRGGRGAVVVISAGNGDCDNSGDGLLAQPLVVGVAASDGNDHREGYSSYGTGVDITAPSGGVLSTDLTGSPGYGSWASDPDYADFSGTSASAPVVAGALLVMFSANPELTAAEARAALCLTADKIDLEEGAYDERGWSARYGCGRVNVGAATALVQNSPPGAPTLLGPLAPAYEDRVVLSFAPPVDPDGDRLRCEVLLWTDDPAAAEARPATDGALDLTGELAAGDARSWTARCADGWVMGPEAEPLTLTVASTAVPEDSGAAGDGAADGADDSEDDGVTDADRDGSADADGDKAEGGCGGSGAALLWALGLAAPLRRGQRALSRRPPSHCPPR